MADSHTELERKRWFRERVRNPAFFLARASNPQPTTLGPTTPITSFSGWFYVAVPKDAATPPLSDYRFWISLCENHPGLPGAQAKDPCPFGAVSLIAAPSPGKLLEALYAAAMKGAPDIELAEVVESVDENWRFLRLDAKRIRLASLLDDPDLTEGDSRLRRDGQGLPPRNPARRFRIREMLVRGAALVLISGHTRELGKTQRLVVFAIPGRALTRAKRLLWDEPERFTDLSRFCRAKAVQVVRRRIERENRRSTRSARRDLRRREAAERWRVRGVVVGELRNVVALVRESAEAIVSLVKAALLLAVLLTWPPVAVTFFCELLRGR